MSFLSFTLTPNLLKTILVVIFATIVTAVVFTNSIGGYWSVTIRNYFFALTAITVGSISFLKIGVIDLHSIMSTCGVMIPAIVVMSILGQCIGSIMDNPNNREDADYKLSVLNALKSIDKNMTLEDLNEKLTKTIEEPDLPDETVEEETET